MPSNQGLLELLAGYRRPGSPMYDHHFQLLPPAVLRRENVGALLAILGDEGLPTKVREHAAGALGEIRDPLATRPLIAALGERRLRRGAAVALGRMRAEEARAALAALAPICRAARWALSQLGPPTSAQAAIDDLRDGHLRLIPSKLRRLSDELRPEVEGELLRLLRARMRKGPLSTPDRWLITCIQALAPPAASRLITRALRQSIRPGLRYCPCTRMRLIRAAGGIAPLSAVGPLVGIVCDVPYPPHQHAAAVCMERIMACHGEQGTRGVARFAGRLRRQSRQLAGTRPGRWKSAITKAVAAIERILAQLLRERHGHRPAPPLSSPRRPHG